MKLLKLTQVNDAVQIIVVEHITGLYVESARGKTRIGLTSDVPEESVCARENIHDIANAMLSDRHRLIYKAGDE